MRKKKKPVIKSEIKVIGIDDAPFTPHSSDITRIFGIIIRGSSIIEGVEQNIVNVDGNDGTEKIVEMLINSKHFPQIKAIMLAGITVGGFNVLDINRIFEMTQKPVIVVIEKHPDFDSIKSALENVPDGDLKWKIIEKLKDVQEFHSLPNSKPIYYQVVGLENEDAEKIIEISTQNSRIPEPLRIAHLIGRSFL